MVKKIAILGSTGSVGLSALKLIDDFPDYFKIVALGAAESVKKLVLQVKKYAPEIIVLKNLEGAIEVKKTLSGKYKSKVVFGQEGYIELIKNIEIDILILAISGSAGIFPTFIAVQKGITVALANKEALVAGGALVMEQVRKSGAKILPLDSEHSALFQLFFNSQKKEVKDIWITASGGPFYQKEKKVLKDIKPLEATSHPNWSMGPKISVDSSNLMNKGLEVIEAHWLFKQPFENIKVIIHPQSVIHGLLEFKDGSIFAQMGISDMRLPISYALSYPNRLNWNLPSLKLSEIAVLNFFEPDLKRFPSLKLAYDVGITGASAPAVLTRVNEEAVNSFLRGELRYDHIIPFILDMLDMHSIVPIKSIEDLLEVDNWACTEAKRYLKVWKKD